MTYEEWEESVPDYIKNDPLWTVAAYRKSLFMGDLAWPDVTRRISDRRTVSLADQLYRASGSVGANIAEGYSRGTGKAASASTNTAWGLREKHATGTTRPVTSSASRSSTTAANCWQRSFASCSP